MSALQGVLLIALAGCATSAEVAEVDAGGGDRVTRGRWVRDEVDRWNAHLDAAGRAEKFAKLRESPHTFFRGTSHLFWSDQTRRLESEGDAGGLTWIQGDCHVENFGSFHDRDGDIVYGPNDFDDGWIADYRLDLWRLATSIFLFAAENGVAESVAGDAVDALATAYLGAMRGFAGGDAELDVQIDAGATHGAIAELLEDVAAEGSPAALLAKWTVDGRFDLGNADLAAVGEAERAAVVAGLPGRNVRDVARRLHAGTSSLGVLRYYVLVDGDAILDVKAAARRSPGRDMVGGLGADDAAVAVRAERALGRDVDERLAAVRIGGAPFLVRALSPWKDDLSKKKLKGALVEVAGQWGRILAVAHARGDRDHDPELVSISVDDAMVAAVGGDGEAFRAALRERAAGYAAQVARDYQAFRSP
jgi:uncharacterized protein (DUF2252 family)